MGPGTWWHACGGVDSVRPQAALASGPRSVKDPLASHAACATGTLNMLVGAKDAGVRRFVYAGSSSAYGDTPTLPKHEGMPSLPRSLAPGGISRAVPSLAGLSCCSRIPDVHPPPQPSET